MKKRFIFFIILFFIGVSPISVMGSVSGIGLYVTDDREILEAGNKILEAVAELQEELEEAEDMDEVEDVKSRMEKLLKGAYKKYEKEMTGLLEKARNDNGELKQMAKDLENAITRFSRMLKSKAREFSGD
ncbi:MAG: hypothetical protein IKJ49_00540 [Bacteroidaceae bacterium]|nr:hypothetical protein [Bacteroidaceae bacterium]